MSRMTYSIESAKEHEKCYECGGEATIKLVADSYESDTGYVDEVPLCEECAERREV
jgi:hypothetical protein